MQGHSVEAHILAFGRFDQSRGAGIAQFADVVVALNGAGSGDGDVLGLVGVNQRQVGRLFHPLPSRGGQRVIGLVAAALDGRPVRCRR